jgi:hypothetical protein
MHITYNYKHGVTPYGWCDSPPPTSHYHVLNMVGTECINTFEDNVRNMMISIIPLILMVMYFVPYGTPRIKILISLFLFMLHFFVVVYIINDVCLFMVDTYTNEEGRLELIKIIQNH